MLQKSDLTQSFEGNLVLEKSGNMFYLYQNTDFFTHKPGFIYTQGDLSIQAEQDNKHIVAIIEYAPSFHDPVVHYSEDLKIQSLAEDAVISAMKSAEVLKSVTI